MQQLVDGQNAVGLRQRLDDGRVGLPDVHAAEQRQPPGVQRLRRGERHGAILRVVKDEAGMAQAAVKIVEQESGIPESCVLDRAHLARITFNDRTLEREVLQLFDRQAAVPDVGGAVDEPVEREFEAGLFVIVVGEEEQLHRARVLRFVAR